MQDIGIGVIGCGAMGISLLGRLLKLDSRLRVAGIFDPDTRSVENTLQVIAASPPVYDCHEELVRSPDVDWVMIASWNCFHKEQAVTALEAGKHVFCQKPLATTLEDCVAMRESWRKSDRLFSIGFTLRYSPHYRKIRELIRQGAVGSIVSMEFNETLDFNHGGYIMGDWRRLTSYAGTHLLEKCCHDIDLAYWMIGSLPRRAASFGGLSFFKPENERHIARIGPNSDGLDAYRTWPGLVSANPFTSDKDIVDNQVAIVEYENGVRATFHTNCNAGIPERRMYILGTEGAIRADLLTEKIEVKRIGFDTKIEDVSADASGGHGGGDDILARELADSMLDHTPPAVGLEEGMISAATCFAIDEAMETGKVVDMAAHWKKLGFGG